MAAQSLPNLSAEEQRVLGSLLEKSRSTPEYYPMTLNSLQTACNQKSSRKPVVNYEEGIIVSTLDSLKKKGLISTVVGGGSRVTKYKHNLAIHYPLVPAELAVLCLLLLRGPLTPGEINSNSGRLYTFETLDEITEILHKLSQEEPHFVQVLAKQAGQKEARYIHLLGEINLDDFAAVSPHTASQHNSELLERIESLETQLANLRAEFDALMQQLS